MQVRMLGRVEYVPTYQAMQAFTAARTPDTPDEIWLCEHPPVFTQGLAGRPEHLLLNPPGPQHIPVVPTDRGGQVTYHGPGQVVAYPLVDLKRQNLYVKEYVFRLEQALQAVLADHGLTGHRVPGAPGLYVRLADPGGHGVLVLPPPGAQGAGDPFAGLGKIAQIGIKLSRHRAYHGVSLNVAMDLAPFERINPCGYAGLRTVDMRSCGVSAGWAEVAEGLGRRLVGRLGG